MNPSLLSEIENQLQKSFGKELELKRHSNAPGGDINDSFRLHTSIGDLFLKSNSASKHPGMFQSEFQGLLHLSEMSSFTIPLPILTFEHQNTSFLILSFLHLASHGDWKLFGRNLSQLHKQTQENYGLDHDNYIGSLFQSNKNHSSWADFYREERLLPLFRRAYDQNYFKETDRLNIERICSDLENRFPIEKPALLHGDLWSGNAAFCDEKPCIYDPAIYYGHREMDLGMTLLFGGFPPEMYAAYNEAFPLENDWRKRVRLTQLYPLLVHVLLFGASYARQVSSILKAG